MSVVETESRDTIEREGMQMVPDRGKAVNGNGRNWESFWRLLSVIAVPWAMWFSYMVIDVRERVAVIEGNRFDDGDATRLMMIINQKADKSDVPPQWFVDRLHRLELDMEKHESRVQESHP